MTLVPRTDVTFLKCRRYMSLFQNVTEYMQDNGMLTNVKAVVVGVSGGADSVALLRVLCEFHELTIKVVHINHMIRGEEADRDEAFVTQLCETLGVSCTVYREDIPKMAREKHMTEEEAGRIFRYECFNKEAEALKNQLNDELHNKSKDTKDIDKAVRIAVAHNMDDLAETVLFNMVRGSSLLGLAGIKPVNGRIIRPLLMTSRLEIEEYLGSLGQSYITDSTNLVEDYTRNKIIDALNNVIPGLVNAVISAYAQDSRQVAEPVEVTISFGEYANPSFESQIETVSKGRQGGVMSTQAAVEELYGDTKDDEWKAAEVQRIKEEMGITQVEEPAILDEENEW